MKLLITAFEPFGARTRNTSADLLRILKKQSRTHDTQGHSHLILPVDFRSAWPRLNAEIRNHQPEAVILMGEKVGKRIAFETTARNHRVSKRGLIQIKKGAPTRIKTALSLPRMPKVVMSRDAGSYLCNFVYFKMLYHKPMLPCLFLHIPALDAKQWQVCQKSYCAILQKTIARVAKAIDGAKANVSTREKKKGAYHGR